MKHEIKTVEELKLAIRECYDSFSEPTFELVIGELFELYSFNEDDPELKKYVDVHNFIQETIHNHQLDRCRQKVQLNFINDNLFNRNLYWLKDKELTIVEVVGINGFDSTKQFYNLECKLTIIDFLGEPSKDIKEEPASFSAGYFIYFDEDLKQYKTYDYIKVI